MIPIPGDRHGPGQAGRLFFATREAAENHLYRGEHERAGAAQRAAKQSSSGNYAAPWPTLIPTVAARLSSSCTRAGGTRRRFGTREHEVPACRDEVRKLSERSRPEATRLCMVVREWRPDRNPVTREGQLTGPPGRALDPPGVRAAGPGSFRRCLAGAGPGGAGVAGGS